jgi:hypothetical protein
MPVQRFRRVEDVPAPAALDPLDPVAMERVWGLLRLATDGLPPAFAPGVRRYASLEAADADRRTAEVARMRRLREADPHG